MRHTEHSNQKKHSTFQRPHPQIQLAFPSTATHNPSFSPYNRDVYHFSTTLSNLFIVTSMAVFYTPLPAHGYQQFNGLDPATLRTLWQNLSLPRCVPFGSTCGHNTTTCLRNPSSLHTCLRPRAFPPARQLLHLPAWTLASQAPLCISLKNPILSLTIPWPSNMCSLWAKALLSSLSVIFFSADVMDSIRSSSLDLHNFFSTFARAHIEPWTSLDHVGHMNSRDSSLVIGTPLPCTNTTSILSSFVERPFLKPSSSLSRLATVLQTRNQPISRGSPCNSWHHVRVRTLSSLTILSTLIVPAHEFDLPSLSNNIFLHITILVEPFWDIEHTWDTVKKNPPPASYEGGINYPAFSGPHHPVFTAFCFFHMEQLLRHDFFFFRRHPQHRQAHTLLCTQL